MISLVRLSACSSFWVGSWHWLHARLRWNTRCTAVRLKSIKMWCSPALCCTESTVQLKPKDISEPSKAGCYWSWILQDIQWNPKKQCREHEGGLSVVFNVHIFFFRNDCINIINEYNLFEYQRTPMSEWAEPKCFNSETMEIKSS